MKTFRLFIMALVALGLAGAGCNKANRVVIETKSAPTGPVELKLKWPLGRHGIQSMEVQMNSELTLPWAPSQTMTQTMTMGQNSALTVTKEMDGGKHELELEYLSARMTMAMGGKPMLSYDSTRSHAGDTNPVAGTLGKLIGAKVHFILDAGNHVESVGGADELLQRMAMSKAMDPAGTLQGMFSGDALKLQVDFAHRLAGKPVQPNDTWPVQMTFPMGAMGTMVMNYTYTLDSWEKRHDHYCAKIELDGTLTNQPQDNADAPGMKIAVHDGKCSGETWFDLDLGMFVDETLYLDMKMDITIPNPMKKKAGAPDTVTIQSNTHEIITSRFALK